jgi:hypothetical protein
MSEQRCGVYVYIPPATFGVSSYHRCCPRVTILFFYRPGFYYLRQMKNVFKYTYIHVCKYIYMYQQHIWML